MSYRCSICSTPVPAGRAELRHVVLRDDGSTQRELRVCGRCHEALAKGATPSSLRPRDNVKPEPKATAPKAATGFVGQEG